MSRQAAVAIIGPRQVGKTTMAHTVAAGRPSLYLDLESRSDRDKLVDPELFLTEHENKLVILDEIHRAPELFATLRCLIDQGRRRAYAKVVVLGSAAINLLRQSSESLAGRIEYNSLGTLNILEVENTAESINQLWLREGFPDS